MPTVETADEDRSEVESGDKASQDMRGARLDHSRSQINMKDHLSPVSVFMA